MLDRSCKEFDAFCVKYGNAIGIDILERLCDLQCRQETTDGVVTITDTYQHDMVNHTLSGYVEFQGEHFDFVIENGNWDGTVVLGWGDEAGIYQPPEPTQYTLLPTEYAVNKWSDPFRWKNYLRQREQAWFTDLMGKYLYDRHFAPGGATEKYWRAKLQEKGLHLGEMSEFEALKKMPKPAGWSEKTYKEVDAEKMIADALVIMLSSLR